MEGGGREEDDGWNQHVAHVGFEACARDAGGREQGVAKPVKSIGCVTTAADACRRGSPANRFVVVLYLPFSLPLFPYYFFHESIN
jgi:hypothetical protein